jgi:hypothetical protein
VPGTGRPTGRRGGLEVGAGGEEDAGVGRARERLKEQLGQEERAEDIGGECLLQPIRAELVVFEAVVEVAGVVDQGIESLVPSGELRGELADRCERGNIESHELDRAGGRGRAHLFERRPAPLHVAARQDDVVPRGRELQRGGLADARVGAGDDDCPH